MINPAQNQPAVQSLPTDDVQASNVPIVQNKTTDSLNAFGEVLDELGSVAPQSVVAAIDDAADTLNPSSPARSSKEKTEASLTPDSSSVDGGASVQAVEHERIPEIPVEVESFLHRVEDHQDQAPHEIVIADGTIETTKANYPSTPVVVLPITKEEEKKGKRKSPKFSFRWLIEWSHKVVKIFAGKVIYKKVDAAEREDV